MSYCSQQGAAPASASTFIRQQIQRAVSDLQDHLKLQANTACEAATDLQKQMEEGNYVKSRPNWPEKQFAMMHDLDRLRQEAEQAKRQIVHSAKCCHHATNKSESRKVGKSAAGVLHLT